MREVWLHHPGAICEYACWYLESLAAPNICFLFVVCLSHSPHEDEDVDSMVRWGNCEAQSMQAAQTLHLSTCESLVSLEKASLDDFIGTCKGNSSQLGQQMEGHLTSSMPVPLRLTLASL